MSAITSKHVFLQAGDFNLRMSVEAEIGTSDGCGGFDIIWTPQFDCWVRLIPLSAALIKEAGRDQSQLTHYIYLRKRDGLKAGMRFIKGERIFVIETVQDPDESERYLFCLVKEESTAQ